MSIGTLDMFLDLGESTFGWCWFWVFCTNFLRIPFCEIPCYWEAKNSCSLYSNKDGSLKIDYSKAISCWLHLLFNEPKSGPQSLTVIRSSIF